MTVDYQIQRLGEASVRSPINLGTEPGDLLADFTPEGSCVLADLSVEGAREWVEKGDVPPHLELAGPRESIYFDPCNLRAGIVTCGGLCPGLNDIIRGLVMTLHHGYGVKDIFGFQYGFAGLIPDLKHPVLELHPEMVKDIQVNGGTILGSSRGPQDVSVIVDTLERMDVRLLFAVGGDGTFRGALKIHDEIEKRGLKIAIIGVPKTIDNDIALVDRTFGFETAVSHAVDAIRAAYAEANSALNGIGLVKLMGRNAGFIAATAALAFRNVNLVLIPELPFDLDGPNSFYQYLERRFGQHKSTVIVVAEGAGQRHLEELANKDASGNRKLGDIGLFLKDAINEKFNQKYDVTLKYIDPSYMIRSAPAVAGDSIFCGYLAQAAAHAGMSGRTGMAVGRSHGVFTHIPLEELVKGNKQVDPEGALWTSVLSSTGQPFFMTNEPPKQWARTSYVPEPCGP